MSMMAIEIEASTEEIWGAFTSPEALRDWFNPTTEIEPRQGGRFAFEGTRGDRPFRFAGSIEEIDPARRMTIGLRSTSGEAATLRFSLHPGDDFTMVELRHEGFAGSADDGGAFWDGDELIPLREYVTGIGPTH